MKNQRGNPKIPGDDENRDTMIQKLWDTAKAALGGNFILIQVYIRKQKIQLMKLEKEKQTKPKVGRGKK